MEKGFRSIGSIGGPFATKRWELNLRETLKNNNADISNLVNGFGRKKGDEQNEDNCENKIGALKGNRRSFEKSTSLRMHVLQEVESMDEEASKHQASSSSGSSCASGSEDETGSGSSSSEESSGGDSSGYETEEVDGDDLRKAGEYGRALLELLEKESHRARILSELLDREQRLNDELLAKQEDITRLRRRATYQQTHLEQLEDQAQELEDSLKAQKLAALEEKRRRKTLEREIEKLRKVFVSSASTTPAGSSCVEVPLDGVAPALGEFTPMADRRRKSNIQGNDQCDPIKESFMKIAKEPTYISPEIASRRATTLTSISPTPRKVKNLAKRAATVGKEMSRLLSNQEGKQERKQEDVPKQAVPFSSPYIEIKQMYEEERERRQQLQLEVESLLEDYELETSKQSNSKSRSIAVDFAVRSLCKELGYSQNRRATIGPMQGLGSLEKLENYNIYPVTPLEMKVTPSPAPRRHQSKKPIISRQVEDDKLDTIQQGLDEDDEDKCSWPALSLSMEILAEEERAVEKYRKIGVAAVQAEGECFMTYVVQLENNRNGWRMVETRFRFFKSIYRWILQHYEGGLLSIEPVKYPKTPRWLRSGTRPKTVLKRRMWLEQTLLSIHQQQPTLVDVLVDFIGQHQ